MTTLAVCVALLTMYLRDHDLDDGPLGVPS